MSDHREFAGVSAQILDEVRLYLEKYYEEPEEIFYGVCHVSDGADLEEDVYPGETGPEEDRYLDEVFEPADEECVSAAPHEEAPKEKRKKPGLFGIKKTGTARESAPAAPGEAFMGAAAKTSGSANAMQMSAPNMKPMASAMMAAPQASAAAEAAPAFKPGRKLEDVIGDLDKTFMELVWEFADRKGITEPELQKKALIDRKAYSKLKCGTSKNPSKSTALALAIGLELNLDDTKDLLSRAGLALSPCSKQDLIVRYFIEKEMYDIDVINLTLYEYDESPLGSH
ncbi:MAG: hypothetical protein J5696_04025 [Lachnospiraceae bacterium]|nr:hypothetical protein [Lachnospiraceae bacterium]